MAFSTNGPRGLSSEINVTPLIDVLLVLLIIFMVIVPLAPLGLDTAIPSPPNPESPIQASETPVLIQMDLLLNGDPAYRVDGISIAHEAMDAHLRDLMASRALRQVLVQADGRLDFGLVSSVVDAGHAAGADTVGLITPAMGH